MGIGYKCFVCSRDTRDQRHCSDRIEYRMGPDIFNQFFCDRGIQADIHAQPPGLFAHSLHCLLHLRFPRRHTCGQKLTAKPIGRLAEDRLMPALLQYDSSFQPGDSSARDQHGLRLICFYNGTFLFPSHRRIPQAGDMRTVCVCKSVQASLVAAHTVIDVFCFSFPHLIHKFRIRKLCTPHDHQIHLALFQNTLCNPRLIQTSDTNCQHSGLFPDARRIFDIKAPRKVDRRHFVLIACGDHISP